MKLLTFAWTSHLKTIMLKGFKRPDLKQLLCLAAKESYIIFNVLLYRQIDDIAIGPSLGPSLASEFLSYHKNWLNNCPQGLQPVFYRRYVNIFILFRSEDYLNYFQDFLILGIWTLFSIEKEKEQIVLPQCWNYARTR